MTNYSIFPGQPQITAVQDGQSVNLGTEFYVNATCWLTHFRVLHPSTADLNLSYMALYTTTNGSQWTRVVEVTAVPAASWGEWATAALATPYQLSTGIRYRVVARHPFGIYAATGGYFVSGGAGASTTTTGPLVVPNTGDAYAGSQGSYSYDAADTMPANTFNGGAYYSDLIITDVDPNGTITLSPSAIASGEAFGTAAITKNLTVSPSGIATAGAFGTAAVSSTLTVSPSGIATAGAFGTAAVTPGVLTVSPSGIATGEAYGTPVITVGGGPATVEPSSIASTEAFGTLTVSGSLTVSPTAISSAQAFGTAIVTVAPPSITISPGGLGSMQAWGTPAISYTVEIAPSGLTSAQAFGTPVLTLGPITILPQGIAGTGSVMGTPAVAMGTLAVAPAGIESAEAFGLAGAYGASSGNFDFRASIPARRYKASIVLNHVQEGFSG